MQVDLSDSKIPNFGFRLLLFSWEIELVEMIVGVIVLCNIGFQLRAFFQSSYNSTCSGFVYTCVVR